MTYAKPMQDRKRVHERVALVAMVAQVTSQFQPIENTSFHFRTFFTQTNHLIPMQPMQPMHREQQAIQ